MLNSAKSSSDGPNFPISEPVVWCLIWYRWLVHPTQGYGRPHRMSRAEKSHRRWHQFGNVCMSLAVSFAVARGGDDATANWRRLFLKIIRFIHSQQLRNLWRRCQEIGFVVSHSVKIHAVCLEKIPLSRGKSHESDKQKKYDYQ